MPAHRSETQGRPQILLVTRRPLPGQRSVERSFAALTPELRRSAIVDVFQVPFRSQGVAPRLGNLAATAFVVRVRHRRRLVHLAGDITYVALATPPRRTIVTFLDAVHHDRSRGARQRILGALWFRIPLRRAARSIAISEATADALRRSFSPSNEIEVVPVPIDPGYFAPGEARSSAPSPWRDRVLQVGVRANKNLERVVTALAGTGFRLSVVGEVPPDLVDHAAAVGTRLVPLGRLDDEDMPAAYRAADVLVFASTAEGLGLPVLEAFALGIPVVTSDREPMRSLAGEAALLVDPEDPSSIRGAIERMAMDPDLRKELTQAGGEIARQFHPEQVAARYLDVYRSLADQDRRPSRPARSGRRRSLRRTPILLDFSLIALGGSSVYAAGFLGALASDDSDVDDITVVVGDRRNLDGTVLQGLAARGVQVVQLPSVVTPPATWRSRAVTNVVVPALAARVGADLVYVPREVAPVYLPAPSVVLARNLLRWVEPADAAGSRAASRITSGMKDWAARRSVARASAVLAPSQALAEQLPRARAVHVVPYGVDLDPVTPPRPEGGGTEDRLALLSVASISPHKRLDVVAEIAAQLVDAGVRGVSLDVWGPPADEAETARLVHQLSERLDGCGRYHGALAQSARARVYSQHDVLVVGSGVESFGFTMVEAMRCGLVVLAPESPITREICGDAALYYADGDPLDGAAVLQANRGRLPELARAGRERSRVFTWESCVSSTLAILRGAS